MRLTLLGLIAAVAVAGLASPALAADPATLSCIHDGVSPASAKAVALSARRTIMNEPDAAVPTKATDELRKVGLACQKKYGWSDEALAAAQAYTIAIFGQVGLTEFAVSKGVDVDAVVAAIDALSPEEAASLLITEDEGLTAFMRELSAAGVPVESAEQATLYGGIAAMVLFGRKYQAIFAEA